MILPFSIPSPEAQYWRWEFGPFDIFGREFSQITIHFYALCLIAGMLAAGIWAAVRLGKRGGERGAAIDFGVWAVVFGIIGARLYHVVTHWGDYFRPGHEWWNPFVENAIWNVWDGGIAIFGAILGGALGVYLASRTTTHIRFWSFADALVPGLLLAQALGRLGNWINHELFGGPTTLPWGLEIETTNPAFPIGLPADTLFHPTFLYEIVWNLLGIVVLLAIERKWRPRWGQFFGLYLIWYGIGRAMIESLRVDPSLLVLGLRTNVATALLAILLGIVIIAVQRRRHPGIETSVYLPGYGNPDDAILEETSDSEQYFHVIDRGDGKPAEGEKESGSERTPETDAIEDPVADRAAGKN